MLSLHLASHRFYIFPLPRIACFLILYMKKLRLRKVKNFLKVPQLLSNTTRITTQPCRLPNHFHLLLTDEPYGQGDDGVSLRHPGPSLLRSGRMLCRGCWACLLPHDPWFFWSSPCSPSPAPQEAHTPVALGSRKIEEDSPQIYYSINKITLLA